jgi:hypothetical protein
VWGLRDKGDLLSWDARIRIIGVYSFFRAGGIGIRNRLLGALSDVLGVQYMLHLGLGAMG